MALRNAFEDLATENTVARRFGGGKQALAVRINTTGDHNVIAPAADQRVRLLWLGLSTSEDNMAEVLVIVRFGAQQIYRWNMGAPGAFAHWESIEGTLGQPLTITLNENMPVEVNLTYELVA